jgi:hypothetical protein
VRQLNKQIKKDSNMLSKHGIMDYSLLLGIENMYALEDEDGNVMAKSGRRRSRRSKLSDQEFEIMRRHMYKSPDGTQLYHLSIIDFLQLWNCSKKTENFLKTTFMGANKQKLSSISPDDYKQRFQKFMRNNVFTVAQYRH